MDQRQRKIELITNDINAGKLVIDVGVWCRMPEPNPSENWLEKKFGEKNRIMALGIDDMKGFNNKYPNIICIQGNGYLLPFADNSIDIIFSNAVLEHIPSDKQIYFISEIIRVAKEKIILSVPDRLSPIEIHSKIFFLHWFKFWRLAFKLLGELYWSDPVNLSNIFTKSSLRKILLKTNVHYHWTIKRQLFYGIPASLIAILNK